MTQSTVEELKKKLEQMLSTVEIMKQACRDGEITESECEKSIKLWKETGVEFPKDSKNNQERVLKFRKSLGQAFGPRSNRIYDILMERTKKAKAEASAQTEAMKAMYLNSRRPPVSDPISEPIQVQGQIPMNPPLAVPQPTPINTITAAPVISQQVQPTQQQTHQTQFGNSIPLGGFHNPQITQQFTAQPVPLVNNLYVPPQQNVNAAVSQQNTNMNAITNTQYQQQQLQLQQQQQQAQQQQLQQQQQQSFNNNVFNQPSQQDLVFQQQKQAQVQIPHSQTANMPVAYNVSKHVVNEQNMLMPNMLYQPESRYMFDSVKSNQPMNNVNMQPTIDQSNFAVNNSQGNQFVSSSLPFQQISQHQLIQQSVQQQPSSAVRDPTSTLSQSPITTAASDKTKQSKPSKRSHDALDSNKQTQKKSKKSSDSGNDNVTLTMSNPSIGNDSTGILPSGIIVASNKDIKQSKKLKLDNQDKEDLSKMKKDIEPTQSLSKSLVALGNTVVDITAAANAKFPLDPKNTIVKPIPVSNPNLSTNSADRLKKIAAPPNLSPYQRFIERDKLDIDDKLIKFEHPDLESVRGYDPDEIANIISKVDENDLDSLTRNMTRDSVSKMRNSKSSVEMMDSQDESKGKGFRKQDTYFSSHNIMSRQMMLTIAKKVLIPLKMTIDESALSMISDEVQAHLENIVTLSTQSHKRRNSKISHVKYQAICDFIEKQLQHDEDNKLSIDERTAMDVDDDGDDNDNDNKSDQGQVGFNKILQNVTMKWGLDVKNIIHHDNINAHNNYLVKKSELEEIVLNEIKGITKGTSLPPYSSSASDSFRKPTSATVDKPDYNFSIEESLNEETAERNGYMTWAEIAKAHTSVTLAKRYNVDLRILNKKPFKKLPPETLSIFPSAHAASKIELLPLTVLPSLPYGDDIIIPNNIHVNDVKDVLGPFAVSKSGGQFSEALGHSFRQFEAGLGFS